jgi:hypothetical protein
LSEDSSHNLTVLSSLQVARIGALWWNSIEVTKPVCPSRVATQVADELSEDSRHNFTVLSSLLVARIGVVGWNATQETYTILSKSER